MIEEDQLIDSFPLAKHLTVITKKYVGVINDKLHHLEIDRSFYPLVLIAEGNGCMTQQMLADKLDIDKVSVVRMIDYLSENECVVRKKNPHDRREHLLKLTSKGEKLVPSIHQAFYEANCEVLQGLGVEEIHTFLKCIDHIQHNLANVSAMNVTLKFNNTTKKRKIVKQHEHN